MTCSSGFLLVAALLVYLDGQNIVLWYAAACVIHEMGHWIAVVLFGGRVRALRLTAVGAEMKLDSYCALSFKKELLAALAGPFVNILFAFFFSKIGWYLFAGINLSMGVINLLPVEPLDGGRILSCILNESCPQYKDGIAKGVSVMFSGIILGLGWYAWRAWGNLTLLVAAVWLICGAIK